MHRIVPGTVVSLPLSLGSSIDAASLGHDGRFWYAFNNPGSGPGLGSVGIAGDPVTFSLPPVARNYTVDDVAVTKAGTVWVALTCACSQPGFATFQKRGGTFTAIAPLAAASVPNGVSLAPDGSTWISERGAGAVAHVARNGQISTISLGDPKFLPFGLLATASRVIVAGETAGRLASIGAGGKITWLHMPDRDSHVGDMEADPDGRVWIPEIEANKIVSIDVHGEMRGFVIPTRNSMPSAVAVDSHGAVWFVERDGDRLGQILPDGSIREVMLPSDLSLPTFIFAGPRDVLYILGSTSHWFGIDVRYVLDRIPAATAF